MTELGLKQRNFRALILGMPSRAEVAADSN